MWRRLTKLAFFRRLGRALSSVNDAEYGRPAPEDPPAQVWHPTSTDGRGSSEGRPTST